MEISQKIFYVIGSILLAGIICGCQIPSTVFTSLLLRGKYSSDKNVDEGNLFDYLPTLLAGRVGDKQKKVKAIKSRGQEVPGTFAAELKLTPFCCCSGSYFGARTEKGKSHNLIAV